ncbi:MAG: ATP-binding cassette domain-containing protein [Bacteroidota bacterium]
MMHDSQTQTEFLTDSAETTGGKVIVIKNLQKKFGSQEVLKNVSLDLFKEENLVVLGKSGSGKSVLIKCIVGLLFPDKGEINVLGKNVLSLNQNELNELRKKIGFLFQSSALYDSMTVKQNLEFPLKRIYKKLSQEETDNKVNEALENVGLADALHKMPSWLSGGMRKRIGLARTIIVDPQIMLYDEPTTGLDPITSNEISQLINEVQKKYHTSSIIITHDLPCARTTANRVMMLKDGEVYANGTLKELENSSDEWIKSFFK